MHISKRLAGLAAVGTVAIAFASPAYAQATRTWVSGVGDDVNPCSRTAPCKTFAGAISKTAAGGEINCLDPGGFGTLTITKSITIDCTGTFGSTLNSGGINGFTINDSATLTPGTIEVRLRGLSINGAGTTPGLNGIRFISGKTLTVEDVFIQNQKSGAGISIAPSAASAKVFVKNTTITNGGMGIDVRPTGTGTATVTLVNVAAVHNTTNGLRVDTTATTGNDINLDIVRSEFNHNQRGITTNSASRRIVMAIDSSSASHNSAFGIDNFGGSSALFVSNSSIMGNAVGLAAGGGASTASYGDNRLQGNPNLATPNNGTFSGPATNQ